MDKTTEEKLKICKKIKKQPRSKFVKTEDDDEKVKYFSEKIKKIPEKLGYSIQNDD